MELPVNCEAVRMEVEASGGVDFSSRLMTLASSTVARGQSVPPTHCSSPCRDRAEMHAIARLCV